MRIGLDAAKALPPWDGVGNVSRHTLLALARLLRDDPEEHEVLLYGIAPEDGERFDREHPDLPASFRRLDAAAPRDREVDVYHCLTYRYPADYAGPGLVTCYDLTVLTHPETHTVDNKARTMLGLLRALYAGARFVAISRFTADELERLLEVPATRVDVVPLGVDGRFRPLGAEPARRQVARRFGIDGDFVLAVGTLEPRKNLRRLFAAWAGLPADLRRATPLVVAGGGGWKHETTDAYLRRHPELGGVRFLGRVTDDELVALYSAATVFAYPSLAEGFGLPVAEAMACGCPVLTSDVSSLPEIAGDAALRVDPTAEAAIRDGLERLLGDPAERRERATAGIARARAFTWERYGRELLEIYRRVAADHGAGNSRSSST